MYSLPAVRLRSTGDVIIYIVVLAVFLGIRFLLKKKFPEMSDTKIRLISVGILVVLFFIGIIIFAR